MSEISTVEIKNMLDELENDNDFIELRKLYETPNCFIKCEIKEEKNGIVILYVGYLTLMKTTD